MARPPADQPAATTGRVRGVEANRVLPPGTWPTKPTWTFGGQLVLFRRDPRIGFGFKVGNGGSEQPLAADVHLPWLGSLYLHTERAGMGVVNRLNGVGYQSKVVSVDAHNGHLYWRLWMDRDGGWNSKANRWERARNGSAQIDPRTLLLGPKRYDYTNHGQPVAETIRIPHGDDHPVRLQLQRVTFGRRRGRKRLSWAVDCTAPGGISTTLGGRGRIYGLAVRVTDAAVATNTWPIQAAVRIAERLTEDRLQNDWRPESVTA